MVIHAMNRLLAFLTALALASSGFAAEKPNILWITSEDNAYHWLGCYGNKQVRTPRLDALAEMGVRFKYAYSNAPVCAVARSTILNGVYAPSQGTQHMRSRYPIPDSYLHYVHYLRKAGYYCTNRSKTDYNFKGNDKAIWDECYGKAHYRNRNKKQPFFPYSTLPPATKARCFRGSEKRRENQGLVRRNY